MRAPEFAVTCELSDPFEAGVLYNGEICSAGAWALEKQFQTLFGYYQYQRVVLQIESPGGSIEALHYILRMVKQYQDQGKATVTRSTFRCASAAALLLSLGHWGERRVDRMTSLLFHTARVNSGMGGMTAAISTNLSQVLESVDRQMVGVLIKHMLSNTGSEVALAQLVLNRCRFVEDHWSSLSSQLATMHVEPKAQRKPAWLKTAEKLGANGVARGKFANDLSKHLHLCMRREVSMDLREAYVLALIDEIHGVIEADAVCIDALEAVCLRASPALQSLQSDNDVAMVCR